MNWHVVIDKSSARNDLDQLVHVIDQMHFEFAKSKNIIFFQRIADLLYSSIDLLTANHPPKPDVTATIISGLSMQVNQISLHKQGSKNQKDFETLLTQFGRKLTDFKHAIETSCANFVRNEALSKPSKLKPGVLQPRAFDELLVIIDKFKSLPTHEISSQEWLSKIVFQHPYLTGSSAFTFITMLGSITQTLMNKAMDHASCNTSNVLTNPRVFFPTTLGIVSVGLFATSYYLTRKNLAQETQPTVPEETKIDDSRLHSSISIA